MIGNVIYKCFNTWNLINNVPYKSTIYIYVLSISLTNGQVIMEVNLWANKHRWKLQIPTIEKVTLI